MEWWSFDNCSYSLPHVYAKGGGGGGGAGVVDYPSYMKTIHGLWLDNNGSDVPSNSVVDAINAAYGSSPYSTADAYNPDADLVTMIAAPNVLQTMVTLLSSGNTLDTLVASVLDQSRIDTAVTEYAADLDARLISDILPRFEAGMRDINAVNSSAFVIGRALIEENQDRQVAKFSSTVHLKAFSDDAIAVIGLKLEYQKAVSMMIADVNRIKIVAKKEEAQTNLKIDSADASWDLEVFQYGANMLASIGGGTGTPMPDKPSMEQSVIGGAMSGAAAGSMISPGTGTVIGAVLGAAAGYMGAS